MPSLTIWVTASEPRTGAWCTDCNLPSAIEVDMSMFTEHGFRSLGTLSACADCGRRDKRPTYSED